MHPEGQTAALLRIRASGVKVCSRLSAALHASLGTGGFRDKAASRYGAPKVRDVACSAVGNLQLCVCIFSFKSEARGIVP